MEGEVGEDGRHGLRVELSDNGMWVAEFVWQITWPSGQPCTFTKISTSAPGPHTMAG